MKRLFQFLALQLLMAVACTAQSNTAKTKRYIHALNMQPLVMKVIDKKTYLGYDPGYNAIICKPSPWLSDFFGIQAIKTLTKEQIQNDFVPKFASIVRSDSNQLELKFKAGFTAIFFINTDLQIRPGIVVPLDHVFFDDSTYQLFTANIESFKTILGKNKLEAKYLIPNLYFKEEQEVYKRIQTNPATPEVKLDSMFEAFNAASKESVMIFPDGSHGDYAHYQKLYSYLSTADYDWFGIEMLSIDFQKAVDDFLKAPEGSASFIAAEEKLKENYKTAWPFRFEGEKPAEHPFITLFRLLREKKKKVYAIENDNLPYLIFRFGETPFGGAVRSNLWAKRLPLTGKGIVFGGSAHFKDKELRPITFQDFYKERSKTVSFFSISPFK